MAGRYVTATIENKYEYVGSEFSSMEDLKDYLLFNLNTAQDIDNYKTDIPQIANKAVDLAQEFIIDNGTYGNGRLWEHVNWRPKDKGFQLFDDARDDYDRAYAGHIEYGFTDKAGIPHGPWPFLRPAMRLAAMASTGQIADHVAYEALYGAGNSNKLSLGRVLSKHDSTFDGVRMDITRNAYGAKNKWNGGVSQYGKGYQNQYRWTNAKHGINHMGRISPDMEDTFIKNFGHTMSEREFRDGIL